MGSLGVPWGPLGSGGHLYEVLLRVTAQRALGGKGVMGGGPGGQLGSVGVRGEG